MYSITVVQKLAPYHYLIFCVNFCFVGHTINETIKFYNGTGNKIRD